MAPAAEHLKPNIIIILADDMGYGDASCYGGKAVKTPHIDQLAAEGLRFTDFHASGCVCSPTRAGLVTGRYQQRTGVDQVVNADDDEPSHDLALQLSEITFAERLRDAGYNTAMFGKWHLGYAPRYNPSLQGFEIFRGYVSGNVDYQNHLDRMGKPDWWENLELTPEKGYSVHLISQHAVKFIETHTEQPFCLYIAQESVHAPYQGPGDPPVRAEGRTKDVYPDHYDKHRAFNEMLAEMDKGVGEIVGAVKRADMADRTFIFFFSDNGGTPMSSNGPLRGFKGSLWEGGHREPAIAWWPGKIKPGVTDELAISIDLMPTLLELGGATMPEGHALDGVSLMPLLMEGKALPARKVFWEYGKQRAMREGKWKLIENAKGIDGVGLYDLSSDIGEKHNAADTETDRVETMRKDLQAWHEEVHAHVTPQDK
ncbi:MAG: sulfatase-like hydrolase/transferase [Planctomycetes bacterium]|nr:sulfatase-like hydrolase/transferase [Planctomycetota bacterium]